MSCFFHWSKYIHIIYFFSTEVSFGCNCITVFLHFTHDGRHIIQSRFLLSLLRIVFKDIRVIRDLIITSSTTCKIRLRILLSLPFLHFPYDGRPLVHSGFPLSLLRTVFKDIRIIRDLIIAGKTTCKFRHPKTRFLLLTFIWYRFLLSLLRTVFENIRRIIIIDFVITTTTCKFRHHGQSSLPKTCHNWIQHFLTVWQSLVLDVIYH